MDDQELTVNEVELFTTIQREIRAKRKRIEDTCRKMDSVVRRLVEAYHKIWGTPYTEELWIADIEYLPNGTVQFDSNWGSIIPISIQELLEPELWIKQQELYKQQDDAKKKAKRDRQQRLLLEQKVEDAKLREAGIDIADPKWRKRLLQALESQKD